MKELCDVVKLLFSLSNVLKKKENEIFDLKFLHHSNLPGFN